LKIVVHKHIVVFALSVIIVSTTLAGCLQREENITSLQPKVELQKVEKIGVNNKPVEGMKLGSIVENSEASDNSSKTQPLTKEDFFTALIKLSPSYREREHLKDSGHNWDINGFENAVTFQYKDTGEQGTSSLL
jgi:hypothetical protein